MTAAAQAIFDEFDSFFAASPPGRLGIAVSGGGDSLALMHLLAEWSAGRDIELFAATVDHGLRTAAAEEARFVAGVAARLGIAHETLAWEGWDGSGNLQDRARRARYRLLGDWAGRNRLAAVALAHTRQDQAETFVMRLARAAGVDGLAVMPRWRFRDGAWFVRPLLDVDRATLRAVLRDRGQDWVEDPSNEDRGYERIRARDALEELEKLGITAAVLGTVAGHMAKAREALDWHAHLEARRIARVDHGDVVLDRRGWRALNDEIARRILRGAILWIAGADYPPRRTKMDQLLQAMRGQTVATLAGCLIRVGPDEIRISREPGAVAGHSTGPGDLWDGRWRVIGPVTEGAELRALGEAGLRHCPDWRDSGLSYRSLAASPAVWQGDTLLAAPLAQPGSAWRAELDGGEEGFFATLLPRRK